MNTHDQHFHPVVEAVRDTSIVFVDEGFRKVDGIPDNLKLCTKGTWNERMFVETALSMVTVICDLKRIHHRVSTYVITRLVCVPAMFNISLSFMTCILMPLPCR